MKRYAMISGALVLGLCTVLAVANVQAQKTVIKVQKQQKVKVDESGVEVDANDPKRQSRSQAGELDDVTSGANIRASQFIGLNIQNENGDSLGEVNDLVINAMSGRVRYAAVTYGGFLGVGNKMFAVPFEAFEVREALNDPNKYLLVLNISQQQLEGATGFDEEHWPDFADRKFTDEIDKRYGVQRRVRRGVEVNIDGNGIDIDVKPKKKTD